MGECAVEAPALLLCLGEFQANFEQSVVQFTVPEDFSRPVNTQSLPDNDMIACCMWTKDIEAEAGIAEIDGHALQECCIIIGMVDIFNILDVITPFFRSLFVIRHGFYYIILSYFFQADGSWVNSFIRRELGAACRTALRRRVGLGLLFLVHSQKR